MRINISAGHNPEGMAGSGAAGILDESVENRRVKDEVTRQLRQLGHTVFDCTVDDGSGQSDVLQKIVAKCNANAVDLDVSIHFNSGANDLNGDGKPTGTEVLLYSEASRARDAAERTCNAIAALGFRNRGVKYNPKLYFLRSTKSPAMLVECCFVDDADDVKLYDCRSMASAIVYGVTGQRAPDAGENGEVRTDGQGTLYRVQVGAYHHKENAVAMAERLKEAGFDALIVQA